MAEITAAAVRALRERTGLPMMDCKKALSASNGDETQAIEWLRERNKGKLEERAGNATGEGRIFVQLADDHSAAGIVEIQCESAPVAGSESLGNLAKQFVEKTLETGVSTPEALFDEKASNGQTFRDLFDEVSGQIREKIVVARVARVEGPVASYVHHDGKSAALFQATPTKEGVTPDFALMRDVAMHITAMRPTATTEAEVDPALVAAEKERLMEEARATGKPENVIEKIVAGRLNNLFVEQGVLVLQPFAKEETKTVGQALAEKGLEAKGFQLWLLGGE